MNLNLQLATHATLNSSIMLFAGDLFSYLVISQFRGRPHDLIKKSDLFLSMSEKSYAVAVGKLQNAGIVTEIVRGGETFLRLEKGKVVQDLEIAIREKNDQLKLWLQGIWGSPSEIANIDARSILQRILNSLVDLWDDQAINLYMGRLAEKFYQTKDPRKALVEPNGRTPAKKGNGQNIAREEVIALEIWNGKLKGEEAIYLFNESMLLWLYSKLLFNSEFMENVYTGLKEKPKYIFLDTNVIISKLIDEDRWNPYTVRIFNLIQRLNLDLGEQNKAILIMTKRHEEEFYEKLDRSIDVISSMLTTTNLRDILLLRSIWKENSIVLSYWASYRGFGIGRYREMIKKRYQEFLKANSVILLEENDLWESLQEMEPVSLAMKDAAKEIGIRYPMWVPLKRKRYLFELSEKWMRSSDIVAWIWTYHSHMPRYESICLKRTAFLSAFGVKIIYILQPPSLIHDKEIPLMKDLFTDFYSGITKTEGFVAHAEQALNLHFFNQIFVGDKLQEKRLVGWHPVWDRDVDLQKELLRLRKIDAYEKEIEDPEMRELLKKAQESAELQGQSELEGELEKLRSLFNT